jgi:Protein of unknown function (DUF2452)
LTNVSKGRDSYDITTGNVVVAFFNRNITPYATSTLGPKFDLVPVTQQKDIMLNVARMHAEQEYNRIMELVSVLQKQADDIKRRLAITDMVHAAKYDFKIANGNIYWLLYDNKDNITRLSIIGPTEWSTGKPEHYEYIGRVKWLGDHTWIEVEEEIDNGN